MAAIDDLAEKELKAAKLPTIFSYRQAFIRGYDIGYSAHKAQVFTLLYGKKVNKDQLLKDMFAEGRKKMEDAEGV